MDNELKAEIIVPQGSAITLQMYSKADVDAYVAKLNEKIEELTGELRIARPVFKCAECGEVGPHKWVWNGKKSSDGMITELQSEKAQAEEDAAYWKAKFEELKGKCRWRNVSEENPVIGERVEAYMPYASDNHVRILRLSPYDPDDGGSQWLNDDDEDDNVGYAFGAVTAWRPLPNSPEENP